MEACLERIAELEPRVEAWAFIDPDHARAQAKRADDWRRSGHALPPLHGLPVGIKDIIDVAGMPVEQGSPIFRGQKAHGDAALIASLRRAGGIPVGKTVTTELAVYHPGKTKNPHDPAHTPGGSSSGSAAAVGAKMVPLAVGTQTNGSVIRPASFCGVIGFKPSYGLIPRTGVLRQSGFLDTVGVLARSVGDAALLAECLAGPEPNAETDWPWPAPRLLDVAEADPPRPPVLALALGPKADRLSEDAAAGFDELAAALGEQIETVTLTGDLAQAWSHHEAVMLTDLAHRFGPLEQRYPDLLSARLKEMLAAGREVRATAYAAAIDQREPLAASLNPLFDRFDAILTPAAPGEAPLGLETTGDPVFATVWTYLGLPAITLPLLIGANGLPIGVQLVGAHKDDGRLLRTANWLVKELLREATP